VPPLRTPPPLHLGPLPESSSQARRFVRDGLTALGVESLIDAAELGVSELVTNACLHARTAITVALRLVEAGVVRIEVSDGSPRQPEQRTYATTATTGRGLRLLASFGTWGVDPGTGAGGGKTVWFEPSAQQRGPSWSVSPTLDDWKGLQ
jgi:hypothetical protein